jgi:hypothetical protein
MDTIVTHVNILRARRTDGRFGYASVEAVGERGYTQTSVVVPKKMSCLSPPLGKTRYSAHSLRDTASK